MLGAPLVTSVATGASSDIEDEESEDEMASELSRLNATRSGGYRLGSVDDDEAAAVRAVAVFENEQQGNLQVHSTLSPFCLLFMH